VFRLRFDLVKGLAARFDLRDDVVGAGFPDERCGIEVPVLGPLVIAALSSATLVKAPGRLSVSSLNQRSIRFSQELEVGVK